MKRLYYLYLILTTSLLLIGCSKEAYVYPELTTEFINLGTDNTGVGKYLLTDQGERLAIENTTGLGGLKKDTVYRVVSRHAPIDGFDETTVRVYAIESVIAPIPVHESEFREIYTDAVELQSIWRKEEFINMVLRVKVKDTAHGFHFIENRIELEEDGTKTLYLTLYHDRKEDVEAFYRTSYLSVPLWHYSNQLKEGDKIVFQLNTYKEGMTSRTFIY
ncbi:MAG: hypothetical protein ACRC3Z_02985 [Phocaeicola sp.]